MFSMKTYVGGKILGFNETATVTEICWPKNEFYENEVVDIRITCDNTACAHDVTKFTVHLDESIIISSDGNEADKPLRHSFTIATQNSLEGCPAGEKREFVIPFEIKW